MINWNSPILGTDACKWVSLIVVDIVGKKTMTSFPNIENKVKMRNMEITSLLDELNKFDGKTYFGLGDSLLTHIIDSFIKAAGVGPNEYSIY